MALASLCAHHPVPLSPSSSLVARDALTQLDLAFSQLYTLTVARSPVFALGLGKTLLAVN